MTFQTITGKRSDGLLYVQDHFLYTKDTCKKGSQYVKCASDLCPATGVIKPNSSSIVVNRHHNHEPSLEEEEVSLYRHSIRERAKEPSCGSFRRIFDAQSAKYPCGSLLRTFPQDEQLMRRSRATSMPPPPKDLDHLHDILNFMPEWRGFALGVSSPNEFFVETVPVANEWNSRVSVMVSPYFSDLLRSEHVQLAMDATFDSRPLTPPSEQLLSIHAFETINDRRYCWPCAYILMERKDEPSYIAGLTSVNGAVGGGMHPLSLIADYEKAPHNAAKKLFPGIETSGCWFHYCNAVWGQVRHLGLVDIVMAEEDVEKSVQKCMALPLLPPAYIHEGLAIVEEDLHSLGYKRAMKPFIQYIKNFWLNDAMVGTDTLSVFELDDRTNNAVERSHFDLFNSLGIVRPSFWPAYDSWRRFDYAQHQDRLRASKNLQIRRKRRHVYDIQDDNIKTMQAQFASGSLDIAGFLSRACHTVDGMQKRLKKKYDLPR